MLHTTNLSGLENGASERGSQQYETNRMWIQMLGECKTSVDELKVGRKLRAFLGGTEREHLGAGGALGDVARKTRGDSQRPTAAGGNLGGFYVSSRTDVARMEAATARLGDGLGQGSGHSEAGTEATHETVLGTLATRQE